MTPGPQDEKKATDLVAAMDAFAALVQQGAPRSEVDKAIARLDAILEGITDPTTHDVLARRVRQAKRRLARVRFMKRRDSSMPAEPSLN